MSREYHKDHGPPSDNNEIEERDWTIAIHRVCLGPPFERGAFRLQSSNHTDEHIIHECINVTKEMIRFLADKLAKKGRTMLFILPHGPSKSAEYVTARN